MVKDTQFGQFMRQRREALGLSLREFCRRNGLHTSDISKLERGLLPPPRTKATLESYAKALKMSPDSAEWNLFRELAHRGQALASPLLPRGKRHSPRSWGSQLEQWADRLDARATLPQLVRRLVHATVGPSSLRQVHMPAQEAVQRPGWDGLVRASEGNAFVPTGLSAWEMSAEKAPQQKAQADFNKRTQAPGPVDAAQATFVFVTLRRWPGKEDWCAEKRHSGPWQDVRAYDADTLEDWLEQAPAVDHWLAKLLGLPAEGAEGIDAYWTNCTESTEPHLAAEVYLASRGENIKQFVEWYKAMPSVMAVETPSPHEALDFAAACYAAAGNEREDALKDLGPHDMAARTLVVRDIKVWRALCDSPNRLALIAAPELQLSPELLAETIRNGHHAFLAANRFTGLQEDAEDTKAKALARPHRHDLEQALRQSGADEKEAMAAAYHSGGSLAVLKRRLARFPETKQPAWSRPGHAADDLVPFLLAGSWNPAWDADRQVIERLSGKPFEENEQTIRRWHDQQDSPFLKAPSAWHFVDHEYTWQWVSREDSWQLLSGQVTGKHVEAFEKIAVEALHEADPRYDLPADERRYAQLHGKNPIHSPQLRRGICETLALLGCKSEGVRLEIAAPKRLAERLVSKALLGGGWQRWASLSPLLPVLAEASPDAFIHAVKADLGTARPALAKLFAETDGETIFADCLYAGLLWALETLAWHPAHLAEVSSIFVQLAKFKTDSWTNGPLNSLFDIFLPWHPGTTATAAQRGRVLKRLAKENKEIAWQLLLRLMPNNHQISRSTSMPVWSGWALNWGHAVPASEHWEQIQACSDLLTSMAGADFKKWSALVRLLPDLPKEIQGRLIGQLEALDASTFATDEKRQLVAVLREAIIRWQSFGDDGQQGPNAIPSRLTKLQQKFEPDNLVAKHLWLFDDYSPEIAGKIGMSGEERRAQVANARGKAIDEIYRHHGWKGFLELADCAAWSNILGAECAQVLSDQDVQKIFPKMLDGEKNRRHYFLRALAAKMLEKNGWQWVSSLNIAAWSPLQAGVFLSFLPVDEDVRSRLGRLGKPAMSHYWRSVEPLSKFEGMAKEEAESFVKNLLEQKRARDAVSTMYWATDSGLGINPSLAMDCLGSLLEESGALLDGPGSSLVQHMAERLFLYLHHHSETEAGKLEVLEWQFLHLLVRSQETGAVALKEKLQREPAFFCQLIRLVFRSDRQPEPSRGAETKAAQDQAWNAYELLRHWDTVPGTGKDEDTAERLLLDWVNRARDLCRESGHLAACDSQIGRTLAREPELAGSSWPGGAVKNLLEEVESTDLQDGFVAETWNKRGVFSKSLKEGGAQEWALAAKYEGYAKDCELDWPVTARMLRRVAKDYQELAKGEDERARARTWL